MPRPSVTSENFWYRVNKGTPEQCWQWMGHRNTGKRNIKSQYGRVDAFGLKGVYVHRLAYFLAHPGEIELKRINEIIVRHTCDNSLCCNPAHLLLGTHEDNVRDMMERGRQTSYTGPGSPNAKLTASDVRAIREQSKAGVSRKALAERFGVSIQTIKAVRSGRHYSDVT